MHHACLMKFSMHALCKRKGKEKSRWMLQVVACNCYSFHFHFLSSFKLHVLKGEASFVSVFWCNFDSMKCRSLRVLGVKTFSYSRLSVESERNQEVKDMASPKCEHADKGDKINKRHLWRDHDDRWPGMPQFPAFLAAWRAIIGLVPLRRH